MDPIQANVAALEAEVTNTEGVEASAATLINGFADQIAAVKNDATKVDAVIARMRASATALGAAVAANPGT